MFGWFKTVGHYERKFQRMYDAKKQTSPNTTIWQRLNELNPFKFNRNGDKKNSNDAEGINTALRKSPDEHYNSHTRLYNAVRQYETAKNNQRWAFFHTAGRRSEGKKRLGYARFIQNLIQKEGLLQQEQAYNQFLKQQKQFNEINDLVNELNTYAEKIKSEKDVQKLRAHILDLCYGYSIEESSLVDPKESKPPYSIVSLLIRFFALDPRYSGVVNSVKELCNNILMHGVESNKLEILPTTLCNKIQTIVKGLEKHKQELSES